MEKIPKVALKEFRTNLCRQDTCHQEPSPIDLLIMEGRPMERRVRSRASRSSASMAFDAWWIEAALHFAKSGSFATNVSDRLCCMARNLSRSDAECLEFNKLSLNLVFA